MDIDCNAGGNDDGDMADLFATGLFCILAAAEAAAGSVICCTLPTSDKGAIAVVATATSLGLV